MGMGAGQLERVAGHGFHEDGRADRGWIGHHRVHQAAHAQTTTCKESFCLLLVLVPQHFTLLCMPGKFTKGSGKITNSISLKTYL